MARWRFFNPVEVHFGAGVFNELPEIVSAYKSGKIILVTGKSAMKKSGYAIKILNFFPKSEIKIFNEVEPNPSLQTADSAAALAREFNPDLVIALGGGSAIDVAKACAALATNSGSIREYFYRKKTFSNPAIPLVAIPTTSGTGSEVTQYSVLTDHSASVKSGFSSSIIFPKIAIVDPKLTLSMSRELTAATGLDAFTHAMESLWSERASEISVLFSIEAIKIIHETLPEACKNLSDLELRTKMGYAQLLAGYAISLAGTNAMHALSYPITMKYNIPHGQACAITMLEVMRAAKKEKGRELKMIADAIGAKNADDAISKTEKFLGSTGLEFKLGKFGAKESDLETLLNGTYVPKVNYTFPSFNRETMKKILKNSF